MEDQAIVNLLSQVTAINKKYEKIAEITGENFNVFRILKVEASEVRTHSAFLAELLNPKGTHGQGDTFLQLFVNKFLLKNKSFDTKLASVDIEKSTGLINEDYTNGGRIDIMITDSYNKRIIIENKIYAGDQENQLIRYYNFDNNAYLYYLTLYGEEPSEWSAGKELICGEHFQLLSYKEDILEWLGLCKKEAVNHPILRETISQYINLINHLTGQTTNNYMGTEIIKLIKENLSSSIDIFNSFNSIKTESYNEFWKIMQEKLNELGFKENEFMFPYKFTDGNNLFFKVWEETNQVNLGFWVGQNTGNQKSQDFDKYLCLFDNNIYNRYDWWFRWKLANENVYFTSDAKENLYKYIDKQTREKTIELIISEVKEIILKTQEMLMMNKSML